MPPEQAGIRSAGKAVEALCRGNSDRIVPIMLVAAHPDDETVGAGSRLFRFGRDSVLIHVTDGSPRNLQDAHAAGYRTATEYAGARRRELLAALDIAGIGPDRCFSLDIPDQEAGYRLVEAATGIAGLLMRFRPGIIVTHPYEGGHPDHDSAAFAVPAAVRILGEKGFPAVPVVEFTSYHGRNGKMVINDFLPDAGCPACTVILSERERNVKERMMNCFKTQRNMLANFPVSIERFRPAPLYDFTAPPHGGKLFYEQYDWGMTGGEWRSNAC
ncbi:MAG: PIG-L deacetylase family protein, partial [Candidatus Latescibacterota bacterium]